MINQIFFFLIKKSFLVSNYQEKKIIEINRLLCSVSFFEMILSEVRADKPRWPKMVLNGTTTVILSCQLVDSVAQS